MRASQVDGLNVRARILNEGLLFIIATERIRNAVHEERIVGSNDHSLGNYLEFSFALTISTTTALLLKLLVYDRKTMCILEIKGSI